MEKLKKYKQFKTKNPNAKFEAWDWGYYTGRYDADFLKLDESKISEYFPAERVKSKTLEIYQELLGLTF